jgi:hypothetical protein
MKHTEFRDWEKIKKIVKEHGESIGKPDIAKGFIDDYDQEHSQLSESFGGWVDLYTEIIGKLLRVYPDMNLKHLLDDDGTYITIEDFEAIEELENEPILEVTIGDKDSEMFMRLKKIMKQTPPKLPRNK